MWKNLKIIWENTTNAVCLKPLRAAPQTTTVTTTTRTTTRHQEPCCELQPGPNPWRSARGARREGSVWSLKQREVSYSKFGRRVCFSRLGVRPDAAAFWWHRGLFPAWRSQVHSKILRSHWRHQKAQDKFSFYEAFRRSTHPIKSFFLLQSSTPRSSWIRWSADCWRPSFSTRLRLTRRTCWLHSAPWWPPRM